MLKYASPAFALILGLSAFFDPGSAFVNAADRGQHSGASGGKDGGGGKHDARGSADGKHGGKDGGGGKHDARGSADGKHGGKDGGGGKHDARGSADGKHGSKDGGGGKHDARGSADGKHGGKDGGGGKHDARGSADGKHGGKDGGGGNRYARESAGNHGSNVRRAEKSGKVNTGRRGDKHGEKRGHPSRGAIVSSEAVAGMTDPSLTGSLDGDAASLLNSITVVAPAMITPSGTLLRSVSLPSILLPQGGSDRASEMSPDAASGISPKAAQFGIRRNVAALSIPPDAILGTPPNVTLGTPGAALNSCRTAIEAAATPFGMLSVRVREAGSPRGVGLGAISVPLDVRIEYARQGGSEIRQAPIRCDLDASGTVIGLS